MRIWRAPLRISLFGGGTDLEPYCSECGSTIISCAVNLYIYLSWNRRPTGGCHLGYSRVEELVSLKDAQHTLVNQAAAMDIEEPCTLTIISDMPKGTGLGSSSALSVILIDMVRKGLAPAERAQLAAYMEHTHSKAGWQDYLPASFGGARIYRLGEGGVVKDAQLLSRHAEDVIERYGLLLYTGDSRSADSILPSWQKSDDQLNDIKSLADEVAGRIDTLTPEQLGVYLNYTWELKRSIPGVTNPTLNRQYAVAMANGALGGKLCGAGAGGCWFFLVPPSSVTRAKIKNALGLREIPFKISQKGVESWEL